jgi:hypothetical protein
VETQLRDYKFNFLAGQTQIVNVPGNFIGVYEATAELEISIDGGAFCKRQQGDWEEVKYLYFAVRSPAAQPGVILQAGFGRFASSRFNVVVNVVTTETIANVTGDLVDRVIGHGAQALIAAANATRRSLLIKALNSNDVSVFIRVGGSATDANHGVELGAGEALPLIDCEDAVYGFNPDAAIDFTVSVTEFNHI